MNFSLPFLMSKGFKSNHHCGQKWQKSPGNGICSEKWPWQRKMARGKKMAQKWHQNGKSFFLIFLPYFLPFLPCMAKKICHVGTTK